jgi:hypothetical protein
LLESEFFSCILLNYWPILVQPLSLEVLRARMAAVLPTLLLFFKPALPKL